MRRTAGRITNQPRVANAIAPNAMRKALKDAGERRGIPVAITIASRVARVITAETTRPSSTALLRQADSALRIERFSSSSASAHWVASIGIPLIDLVLPD